MPIVIIPIKAKQKYLGICEKHNKCTDKTERVRFLLIAHTYLEAIEDCCGSTVAGSIACCANLLLEKDRPACCGIYLDMDD